MVHASLRAIGPVEGRAAGVIDALDAAVGDSGTLLMVLGSDDSNEPFEALRTPAQRDMGTLAEVFRTTAGTRVSDHPEGRFGARGARARELLENPPWHDYYGPDSPLDRFLRAKGRVLRMGADLETATVLHLAEYLVELPQKRSVRRHRRIRRDDGIALVSVECLDDEYGIVDYPPGDYFGLLLRDYLATGAARSGRVGGAPSELIEAQDLVDFGVRWMAKELGGA
jgi:aminoglycoside N3'-acetyltransferase